MCRHRMVDIRHVGLPETHKLETIRRRSEHPDRGLSCANGSIL
jgi:hypothetical protein